MAVSINIPGVGTVNASNAATESTLQAILGQLQVQSGAQLSITQASAAAWRTVGVSANQSAEAFSRAASSAQQQSTNVSNAQRAMESIFVDFSQTQSTVQSAINMTGRGLRDLSNVLLDISTTLVTSYKSIAQNPISLSAQLVHQGLELAAQGLGGAGKIIGAALGSAFGPGGTAAGAITGALVGKVGQVAARGFQAINQILSQEMQSTIESFRMLTGQGAVFANGMSEMRVTANKSGMTIDQFSVAVQQSDRYLRAMGTSFAGASQKVVEVSQYFDRDLGNGMGKLRDEMLALGYTYEEQYGLTAQYLTNLRAVNTNEQISLMTEEDLAKNTRQYAQDLKQLQAFTKEDVRAKMEEARLISQRSEIMARLGPEQGLKFQNMLNALPEQARKGFIEMVATGGAVVDQATNIAMAQNSEYRELLQGSFRLLNDSAIDASEAIVQVQTQNARAAAEQERVNRSTGGAIGLSALLGGANSEAAEQINQIVENGKYGVEAARETRQTLGLAAEGADELTKNTLKLVKGSQEFAVSMENRILPYMKDYAKALYFVNRATLDIVGGTLDMITGTRQAYDVNDAGEEAMSGRATFSENLQAEQDAWWAAKLAQIEAKNLTQEKEAAEIEAARAEMLEFYAGIRSADEMNQSVAPIDTVQTRVYDVNSLGVSETIANKPMVIKLTPEDLKTLADANNSDALIEIIKSKFEELNTTTAQGLDYSRATSVNTRETVNGLSSILRDFAQ